MRIFLFIFAALIASGATGYYLFQELSRNSATGPDQVAVAEPETTIEIYAASRRISAGTILSSEMLTRMAVDEDALTDEMVIADEDGDALLLGSVLRYPVSKGIPVPRSFTVQPGDGGFLAAVLPRGKRAISIEITEVAGLIGLVLPGDHVDILLTYAVEPAEESTFERDIHASETVITNLRVLALDQRLQAVNSGPDEDGNTDPQPIARVATLEVTPDQAETLVLAGTIGELSLALNSVRDGGENLTGLDELLEPMLRSAPGDSRISEVSSRRARTFQGITLDTDITSLHRRLREQFDADLIAETIPDMNVRSNVVIVRGVQRTAVQFNKDKEAAAEAAAGGAASQPVAN